MIFWGCKFHINNQKKKNKHSPLTNNIRNDFAATYSTLILWWFGRGGPVRGGGVRNLPETICATGGLLIASSLSSHLTEHLYKRSSLPLFSRLPLLSCRGKKLTSWIVHTVQKKRKTELGLAHLFSEQAFHSFGAQVPKFFRCASGCFIE